MQDQLCHVAVEGISDDPIILLLITCGTWQAVGIVSVDQDDRQNWVGETTHLAKQGERQDQPGAQYPAQCACPGMGAVQQPRA